MTNNDDTEPVNIADVRADDALIDDANAGNTDAMKELIALFRAVNRANDDN